MNPIILVNRISLKSDATLSEIWIKGIRSFYKILEDIVRASGVKVAHETAIPAGIYPLTLRNSDKFSHEYYTHDGVHLIPKRAWQALSAQTRLGYAPHMVIHVENVPNFAEILHHWGNTAADTWGCSLLGLTFGQLGNNTAVLASRDAYVAYYAIVAPLIRLGGQFIEYRNSFPEPIRATPSVATDKPVSA